MSWRKKKYSKPAPQAWAPQVGERVWLPPPTYIGSGTVVAIGGKFVRVRATNGTRIVRFTFEIHELRPVRNSAAAVGAKEQECRNS